ncbi:arginine--tRNA ligase [bacterium]|nr:arginine--tRNA ligase [bacterium]
MIDFATQLTHLLGPQFSKEGLDPNLAEVRRSARPDLGDFQCNGALAGAKQKGENPRALADRILEALRGETMLRETSVAGPGFINLALSETALAEQANRLASDPQSGLTPVPRPLRVLVDFAGPNVAKPMHVGHLRATVIGDSLQRIGRALGHHVTSDAHFGDWGLQIGLLIISLEDEQPDLPYFKPDYNESMWLETPPVTMEDLDRMYPAASARMKEDEAYKERARKATAELQKGRPGYLALHKHFWKVSQVALEREFTALNIHFDLWKGESDVNYLIQDLVKQCKEKGVAVPDQGALVIQVARPEDKKEVPPLLLVSSEGSAMYGTTDLATIVEREREVRPELYLYVVDQRQSLHFTQVFRAAEKAGVSEESRLEHIGFGTMNGTDGKPFKTRSGGVIKLHDLITSCTERAMLKMQEGGYGQELSDQDRQTTARLVGTAALKFADLSNYRLTDYVFDLDRFTSFEGKTGPYLQFQGVRIKALLRKASEQGLSEAPIQVLLPEEKALVLTLDGFNAAVHLAFEKRAPHFVAEHVYGLAQAFSTFYVASPKILDEKDEAVRGSRLRLARAVLTQLELGLGLLGIQIPERM